jgi:AraC family L-rhamnose operon regulatory protein RhaS
LRLQPVEQLEMKSLLDRLLLEYKDKRLGHQILTKTKLLELFIFLSRCYESSRHSPISSLASDEKIIVHVCDFIRQHYAKPLTLQQVSQLCGMSPSAFSAKFKMYTGHTFIEFRNDIRIHHAAGLLRRNEDKVIAVAQEVGFDDVSFFNKLFKMTFGCSPGTYRQRFDDRSERADSSNSASEL